MNTTRNLIIFLYLLNVLLSVILLVSPYLMSMFYYREIALRMSSNTVWNIKTAANTLDHAMVHSLVSILTRFYSHSFEHIFWGLMTYVIVVLQNK